MSKVADCQICYCEEECLPLACEHTFCEDCMKQYTTVQIEKGETKVKCPGSGCMVYLEGTLVMTYLSENPELKKRFEEFLGGNNEDYSRTLTLDGVERRLSKGSKFTPPGFLQELPKALQEILGPDYYRLGVFADGSCFYHSMYELCDEKYAEVDGQQEANRKAKREAGVQKRKDWAKSLTEADVLESGVYQHNVNAKNWQKVTGMVGDCERWAEDEDFLLTMHKNKMNVWLLEMNGKQAGLNVEVPPGGIDPSKSKQVNYSTAALQDRPNLLVLYLTGLHFEPIVRVDEAKGAMQRVFTTDSKVIARLSDAFAEEYAKLHGQL